MKYMVMVQKSYIILLWVFLILFILVTIAFFLFFIIQKIKKHSQEKRTVDLYVRLAHDLRTPITTIEGYTYLSRANIDNKDKITFYLDRMDCSAKYMQALINDTIELTKGKNQEGNLSRINLLELIDLCVDNVSHYTRIKGIEFVKNLSVSNTWVMADGLHLTQVLTNLLTNAMKYSYEKGTVELKVMEEEKTANLSSYTFCIKDNGCGMSKEFQKKMFEPFVEEHKMKTEIPSSGLGLFIVKKLVDQMQGVIFVESEENKGSCFTIKLDLHHFMSE